MRFHDWQLRFAEFASARRDAPFAWGANDCCVFAADAVLAMTGVDHAADFRGTYSTTSGAARMLGERGGVAAIATAALGDPIPVLMANVGDVVLVDVEGREALAICNGTSAMGPGEHGAVCCGMDAAKVAWRVG